METGKKIVQLRKKSGLNSIVTTKHGSTVKPMTYRSKTRNPKEDGVLDGEYKGKTIIDTKHYLSPTWDDINHRWYWGGTPQDLSRLIEKMKLEYPKGHRMEDQIIKPSENDMDRLSRITDEVFTHRSLYGKFFMDSGRIALNLDDPRQEFLYFCYISDLRVEDKSREDKISPFIQAGTKYEMRNPKRETSKKKDTILKSAKADQILIQIEPDVEKMKRIATIMSLPSFNKNSDPDGLFLLINDQAAKNEQHSSKYGKTYQDRFIELGEKPDEELEILYNVILAKNAGILRARQGHYLFNGSVLDNIDSESQLFSFFENPQNQDKYLDLLELISAKK